MIPGMSSQVRSVQPGQVSPAKSNQSNQVRSTKPGKISTTRSGQPIQVKPAKPGQVSPARSSQSSQLSQVRSTQSGQFSPARSDQSSQVQIPFNFIPNFSFQLQVATSVQPGPNRGSVQIFPVQFTSTGAKVIAMHGKVCSYAHA